MRIDVLTLFPEIINAFLKESIIKRALLNGIVEINVINFRDYSKNKHNKVDDYPYGGGAGMVLTVQPIYDALINIEGYQSALKILLSPQGKVYEQKLAYDLSKENHIIILCGHYEGFDERIRSLFDIEISLGDYVLTGGEIAALAIIDSVTRLIPKVLNKEDSSLFDSFSNYLLEHPHYTRPSEFMGMKVPDVLMNGNHKNIKEWREKESIKRTKERRPDLLKKYKEN